MGLRVPDAQVTEAMQRMRQQSLMFGRQPPSNLEALRPALTNLMLASTLIERTADGFKASQPRVAHELAVTDQRVKLDLVHFLVDDFKKQVPEPTAEQLQKQFDEFKNTPPGAPTDQNPFGFGYLEPARVKLLYLTIPAAEVAKKLRGEPDSEQYFEWRTKAVREFRANPARYPASQPASQPTTNTTTQPTTQAAATQPAPRELTKELEAKIIDQLIQPELERQVERIAASVADRLRVDYEARQRKADAVPDFGTLAYLDRVKADVQQKHGVTLGVSEISQPKTEKELAELKGVGRSTAGEQPFGTFVMRWAEPLVSTALRASPEVLSVNEPTPVFRDLDGNAYVAQLREATPPHAPANLDAVKQAVQEDVRTKLAFELAVAAAKKLQESAPTGDLAAAAKAAGRDVFTTPEFMDRAGNAARERQTFMDPESAPVPMTREGDLPPRARQKLAAEAFELLAQATPERPNPVALVELPSAGRATVARLAEVERSWTDAEQGLAYYRAAQRLAGQRASRVLADYFSFNAMKQRLNYRSATAAETPAAPAT